MDVFGKNFSRKKLQNAHFPVKIIVNKIVETQDTFYGQKYSF